MSRCLLFIFLLQLAGQAFSSDTAADEQSLWQLERAGWYYVEKNDLSAYSNLWHENFLSWPSLSAVPIGRDHVTDSITSETSKGHVFKLDDFKPAGLKVTGDVAFVAYWITFRWLDRDGKGAAHTARITHAWLRSGKDWRIIGGMSMREAENPPK